MKVLNINGFSLVELVIVIVIIGLLSAIAIPIYKSNVDTSRRTEAVASITSIRDEILVYYGTEGHFPIETSYASVIGKDWSDIRPGELTGLYFVDNNFHYRSTDGVEFRIRCLNNNNMENNVWLDHNGDWKYEVEE